MNTHIRPPAVLGLDIGGTSSRAAVMTPSYEVLNLVTGPGANLRSSAGDLPAQLTEVFRAVLREVAVDIQAVVAGVAGAGAAGMPAAQDLLSAAAAEAGLQAPMQVVPDPVIAFAAGSPDPDGALLLAGTGAIAASYRGFTQTQRADGLGWKLGDIGGGIWLALEGLRAAAAALDNRGAPTSLTEAALELTQEIGPSSGDPRQDLIRLLDKRSPAELGAFARRVTEEAEAGDPTASAITEGAAAGLLQTLSAVDDGESPVVLAGSVLTSPGPIRQRITETLGARARDAAQPVIGALRLAARAAGWPLPWVTDIALPEAAGHIQHGHIQQRSIHIDHYRQEDHRQLYEICLRTGDSGEDATGIYQDPDLLGHLYLGAYLQHSPELARVLRSPEGLAVGYCVGVADTTAFERWCEQHWWPQLRRRYPLPVQEDESADARLIRKIHNPPRTTQPWLAEHPAHLHIDLLPEAQGGGNGAKLLRSVLAALTEAGAAGVHLGVGARNVRAIGFYEHMGLRTLEHLPWGLTMGTRLTV
ncbi:GNAT family N-acetyltransferase [Nesterenkonia sp. MY13]|uniref:GNAT family N-acetyltransferase n=1 Tax=Nesterenkonia sedimenti TaxID=1463632 RepID=A0A7X8TJ85_9MICC|nr:GNAT family N-acetyltransferase [Nesterenkonia sedimenti]NLS09753.1 GNAT family N-acetyltransferase [Nesterenkonia sedimenti]